MVLLVLVLFAALCLWLWVLGRGVHCLWFLLRVLMSVGVVVLYLALDFRFGFLFVVLCCGLPAIDGGFDLLGLAYSGYCLWLRTFLCLLGFCTLLLSWLFCGTPCLIAFGLSWLIVL